MNIYKTFNCRRCDILTTRDKRVSANVCVPCAEEHRSEGQKAVTKVAKAVRAGVMAKASIYKCVDCDKPAVNYDHRDYTKPLEVQPVCKSCNGIRGFAMDSKLREFITPVKQYEKMKSKK